MHAADVINDFSISRHKSACRHVIIHCGTCQRKPFNMVSLWCQGCRHSANTWWHLNVGCSYNRRSLDQLCVMISLSLNPCRSRRGALCPCQIWLATASASLMALCVSRPGHSLLAATCRIISCISCGRIRRCSRSIMADQHGLAVIMQPNCWPKQAPSF